MTPAYPLISDYATHFALVAPDREAVIFGEQRLTYRELSTRIEHCARALLAAGIKKGDRVATLCNPSIDYWVIFLATTSIGAVWLGVNPKYKLAECRYVLEDAKPKLLFVKPACEGRSSQDMVSAVQQDYPFIEQVVSLPEPTNSVSLSGTQPLSAFLSSGDSVSDQTLQQRQADTDRMDPALLVYTSGSTGKPKGALLSHYGLCFGAEVQNKHYQLKTPKVVCNFPINHVACVADTCCVNLVAGGTLVFQERFDPAQMLRAIEQERLTIVGGVPTMLLMLLEHPNFEHSDFSSVEMILWGGAALPLPTIKRLQKLAPRLMNVYGMTETAANTTYTSPDADLEELSETIGRPSPHMPCRIMDTEGNKCSVGEEGELQFKGDYLLLEYLNRPEATRDVYTKDGWLHTGDVGYWRDNGTISLVGRMSDMFKSGGYNVYPREIELLLETHPAIDMAAVVGVPDDRFQEVGAAFVQLKAGQRESAESLKTWCSDKLANYKVPKHIFIKESLPRLPVGKVDKVALKNSLTTSTKPTPQTVNE